MAIAPYDYKAGGAGKVTGSSSTSSGGGIAPYSYATGGATPTDPVLAQAQTNQAAAEQASTEANSASGIFKNTLSDIGSRLVSIPVNFVKGVAATYNNAATSIPSDIETAADEYARDSAKAPTLLNEATSAKDLAVGGGRAAGDFAGAVFAPISSAIGSAVQATGAQSLMDHTGQEIVNHSGITDFPAFQKFAMQHPNAGDDFSRLLNVLLGGEESGGQDAVKTASDAKALAAKIVTDAAKPPEVEPNTDIKTAVTKATGAPAEPTTSQYGSLKTTPVVDTQATKLAPLREQLDNAQTNLSILKDSMADHPGKGLVKYRSPNTGDLPFIEKGATSKFGSRGDVIGQDAVGQDASGNGDWETLNNHLHDYLDLRTRANDAADQVRNIRQQISLAKKGLDEGSLDDASLQQMADQASPRELGVIPDTVAPHPLSSTSGDTVTSRASDLNEKLVAQGIDALPPDELAKFNSITKADQIVRVSNFMSNDPIRAVQAALGHADVPEGMHPQVLYNTVAKAAEDSGNLKLMADLAKSPHASALSEGAQTMSAARFNRDADSTVANLERIRDIKTKDVPVKDREQARRAAKSEGNKIQLSKEDQSWNKFLNSIKC